ncbi:MAG: hypothetical protein JXB39_03930 [Deltaproteobacteria bacterium]|nr:hypothetical protein [Deltaproteobacteria bacterium]
MDAFFALNRLSAYLDGDLSEVEAAEVARAIEENDEVRAAWEEMRRSVAFLRAHGPLAAPARFHMRVMSAVEALPSPASWLTRLKALLRRIPVQAAGVAAIAAIVLGVIWRLPEPEPAPAPAPTRQAAAPEPVVEPPETAKMPEAPEPPQALASEPREEPPARPAKEAPSRAPAKASSPYIPAWETLGTAGEDAVPAQASDGAAGVLDSPFVYRLYPTDPDVLRPLALLAERLGGTLVTPSGTTVEPWTLSVEQNHAAVLLKVPANTLEQVEPALRRLGGLLAVQADEERLFGGPSVDVGIEVIYRP